MTKYELIFESLQNQINNGLITYELAEEVNDLAYEKYVMEDKSDIASVYARKDREEKIRSQKGATKRPKITKNMTDHDKLSLRYYDHGSMMDNKSGVISARGSGAKRDDTKQDAKYKLGVDKMNRSDARYYNNDDNFQYVSGYSGTGLSKRKLKK